MQDPIIDTAHSEPVPSGRFFRGRNWGLGVGGEVGLSGSRCDAPS